MREQVNLPRLEKSGLEATTTESDICHLQTDIYAEQTRLPSSADQRDQQNALSVGTISITEDFTEKRMPSATERKTRFIIGNAYNLSRKQLDSEIEEEVIENLNHLYYHYRSKHGMIMGRAKYWKVVFDNDAGAEARTTGQLFSLIVKLLIGLL